MIFLLNNVNGFEKEKVFQLVIDEFKRINNLMDCGYGAIYLHLEKKKF